MNSSIVLPDSFLYNSQSVTISVTGLGEGVTLSGVKIKNLSTMSEITLNSNNYSLVDDVITLDFSIGDGREEIPVTWNNVEVWFTVLWSDNTKSAGSSVCSVDAYLDVSRCRPEDFIIPVDTGCTISGYSNNSLLTVEKVYIDSTEVTFTDQSTAHHKEARISRSNFVHTSEDYDVVIRMVLSDNSVVGAVFTIGATE